MVVKYGHCSLYHLPLTFSRKMNSNSAGSLSMKEPKQSYWSEGSLYWE